MPACTKVGHMPHLLVAVIVGLAVCQLGLLLTTLYLHRTVSHRAITLAPWFALSLRALVWLTTGIRPREWAAVHRRHHAYTDVPGDPHSPILDGYWKVQLFNAGLYRRAAHDPDTLHKYSRDIKVDRWDEVLFNHGFLGLAVGTVGLWALLGWEGALVAAGVHAVSYLLLNGAINAIGHRFGKRAFPGYATNNQWLAFLTWGEGFHSNHHAAPTSARLSFSRWQLDPGWWVVRLCRGLHWLEVRHTSPHLTRAAREAYRGDGPAASGPGLQPEETPDAPDAATPGPAGDRQPELV
jgi:stearoyl-CoA desaturase (delta-9 desaturase)